MLTAKDIHIGDILEAKSKTNKLHILIESIIDKTFEPFELVWAKVLVMNEKIKFECCIREYMIWLSDESEFEYSKICNVFELEGQNGHKAV